MMEQFNAVLVSLKNFWIQFSILLPNVLVGLLLLIVGWLVAKVVRKATIRILKLIRLDVLAEKSGVEDFLIQGGVKFTTVTILANLVYWFILFTVALAVLNSFGLQVAAELFNKIILYIPNVVVSVLVLIFGGVFANLIRTVTSTYLNNIGMSGVQVISSVAYYAIMFFVVSLSLEQLNIGGAILTSAFQIAFGSLCLALALAFGLGGKEWAGKVLENAWRKS